MKGKWKLCVISGGMLVFAVIGAMFLLNAAMASADEERKEFRTGQSVSGSSVKGQEEVALRAKDKDSADSLQDSGKKGQKETGGKGQKEDSLQATASFTWVDNDQIPLGNQIAQYATFWQGVRYEFGGATLPKADSIGWRLVEGERDDADTDWEDDDRMDDRGVDSSGFVQAVFKQYKIKLPRNCKEQAEKGKKVEIKDVQPGDLIFYGASNDNVTHCGIAAGDGKVVHSSSKAGKVIISDMNYRRIVTVRRVI